MKVINRILSSIMIFALTLFLPTQSSNSYMKSKYNILGIYQEYSVKLGTLAITDYRNVEKVNSLLVPTTLNTSAYEVSVTRKANNVYKIDGTDIYVITQFCYKYSYSEDVIINIESNYSYYKGEIIFY